MKTLIEEIIKSVGYDFYSFVPDIDDYTEGFYIHPDPYYVILISWLIKTPSDSQNIFTNNLNITIWDIHYFDSKIYRKSVISGKCIMSGVDILSPVYKYILKHFHSFI